MSSSAWVAELPIDEPSSDSASQQQLQRRLFDDLAQDGGESSAGGDRRTGSWPGGHHPLTVNKRGSRIRGERLHFQAGGHALRLSRP
jgi:hypothetical protein